MFELIVKEIATGKNIYVTHFPTLDESNSWLSMHFERGKNGKAFGVYYNNQYEVIGPIDRTAEYEARQAEIQARIDEINNIKTTVTDLIDNSDKPLWEKKLLKLLVREINV